MNYNGTASKRIIRLNTNGAIDNLFKSGTSFDKSVSKIKLQNDGKILVGGTFTSYNNIIANNLIRLNIDGSKDNSFLTEATPNNITSNTFVNDIDIQNDGKILIAGSSFCTVDGTRRSLARLLGMTSSLSTNKFQTNQLNIYPNPVKDILNIKNIDVSSKNYEIFNLLGSKIVSGIIFNNQLDISNFTSGIYILKIKADDKIIINKFIKD